MAGLMVGYSPMALDARQVRVARGFLRAAVVCGVVPLVGGLGILGMYWLTENDFWVASGLWGLLVGGGMVVLGLAFLVVWAFAERRAARVVRRRFRWWTLVFTGGLLVANFPVAGGCVIAGIYMATASTVEIVNETGAVIDRSAIILPDGRRIEGGRIAAGMRVRRRYHMDVDGPVTVWVEQGGKSGSVVAAAYNTSEGHSDSRVTVDSGLVMTAKSSR
ncbi:MAG TPA: hypothetical protein VHQ47_07130 [Phycisphaerae bacterium]|nr:hypothetical protein [Phycisphaerae bacterium]